MASATSGDVVWEIETLSATGGEDFDAAGIAVPLADTVQAKADFLGVVDIATGTVYTARDRVRIALARLGADAGDMATGDARLVGLQFRYNANA